MKDSNKYSILIKGAKTLTSDGFKVSDIFIKNGEIENIKSCPDGNKFEETSNKEDKRLNEEETCDSILEAKGCIAIPSFVDMHVHLREPGFSYKETIETGTAAAAAGGFTTVCPMPNVNPAPDSLENLKILEDLISKTARIDVLPFSTITMQRDGKDLVDYKALAPYVAGFSDDGTGVQSEEVMRKAMNEISKTGKLLAAHCEVEELVRGGYIHEGEYALQHGHRGISSESEWKEVERDIKLAQETGCRLHICHVSTKESVELIRNAKAKGIKVTAETGPHYLTFSDKDLQEEGRFKMNPPIRSEEDRQALREGVIDGTIDVIATDHAPHSEEEKNRGLEKSAMGVVGLETAFAAVYTSMVDSGLMPFERLVNAMAVRPRQILEMPDMPFLQKGMSANIVIVNLDEEIKVDPEDFYSKGKATPYAGMTLKGKIKTTIYNGKPVYNTL